MIFTVDDKAKLKAIRNLSFANTPALSVYLGAMELVTSTDKTTVTVANTVRKVMSVWLTDDPDYEGVNYYANPKARNFTDKTITLDTELPITHTNLRVAYYSDCPDCEWNEETLSSRNSQCSACNGKGMTLSLGDAVSVPVIRLSRGMLMKTMGMSGEEASGIVAFRAKAEHENMICAAIKMVFNELELQTVEEGEVSIDREYGISGECMEVTFLAPYKQTQ